MVVYGRALSHNCGMCGRAIRWALSHCFDCNAKLRRVGRVPKVDGEYVYEWASPEPVGQEPKA